MDVLNRAAVVLVPRAPYIEWANSFEDDGPTIDVAKARDFATTFLVPEPETLDDVTEVIRAESAYMFECALAGWMTDEESWPAQRDYSTLTRWFEIEVYEMLIDLANEPFILEDL
jgi:hypothetical protein